MHKHYNIRIFGNVIGVGFRYGTDQAAVKLGITGMIRNDPDGTVWIEAEGPEDALKQLVEWCKTGPKYAKVKRVEVSEGHMINYSDFKIL